MHVVVKLPYIDLLPQTELREVTSCTALAQVLPRLKGSCSQKSLFDMTLQAGLQSDPVVGGIG